MRSAPGLGERLRATLDQKYGLLLLLLTASFIVTGIDGSGAVRVVAGVLNLASLAVAFACTDLDPKSPIVATLAVMGVLGTALVGVSDGVGVMTSLGATAHAALLATITVAVLRRVATSSRVTTQTIIGAIAGYFLVGHVFAWVYLALPGFTDQPALDPQTPGEVPIYFSYVVLTTLGFGDVTPTDALAQRITILEALTGQVFLAVLVARLVSVYERKG